MPELQIYRDGRNMLNQIQSFSPAHLMEPGKLPREKEEGQQTLIEHLLCAGSYLRLLDTHYLV